MSSKRFFVTGGGTGGHIYPAVAVADVLQNYGEIFYVGNPNNLEYNVVKNKNYTFLPVISSGMPRKACFDLINWAFQMFLAWIKCCFYIAKYKPDAVFGTGGYVSAPVLAAAVLMKVPFVMHDCDANPGLVTRKLSPFAKSISVAFDIEKEKLNNKNCFVNGNPIRKEFFTVTRQDAQKSLGLEDKLTICIMGGSQGAKSINDASVKILKTLSERDIQVIFQTGKRNYESVIEQLNVLYPDFENDKNLIIKPYFDDMASVLKSGDIAVSRAGSLSISEICACGVAAIYVPYPYAAADHQRKNAKYMADLGAGIYLENDDTTSESLLKLLISLIEDKNRLNDIRQKAYSMAKFDAVDKIVRQIVG